MCGGIICGRHGDDGDGCSNVDGDGISEDVKSNEADEWEMGCQLAAGPVAQARGRGVPALAQTVQSPWDGYSAVPVVWACTLATKLPT